MHPELFRLPFVDLPVHTFGLTVAIAFLLAVHVIHRQALRSGQLADEVLDASFWVLLGAIIGGRLVFVIVEWRTFFVEAPWVRLASLGFSIPRVLAVWQGGFVSWGDFFGGVTALMLYARARGVRVLALVDLFMLAVPLAEAVVRIGCLSAGCCFGQSAYHLDKAGGVVADLPLTLRFPPGSIAYSNLLYSSSDQTVRLMHHLGTTVPLVPWQPVQAVACIALFYLLLYIAPRKRFHGQVFLTCAIGYSVIRSFLELFRGDEARGFAVKDVLSTGQFLSIFIVIASIITWVWAARRARQARSALC